MIYTADAEKSQASNAESLNFDVVILGAGAAGLMCAIEAGKRGRRVLVVDHAKKPAEKIRISGGGRCNFTNLYCSPDNFISNNPHFCKSALKRYTQYDFIEWIESHNIAHHEKTLGQLFCDNSAKDIIAMLLEELEAVGGKLWLERSVKKIQGKASPFTLMLDDGQPLECESLVIATGGPSIPKMGSTGYGYEVAKQFGIDLVPRVPALVPFTVTDAELATLKNLSGIALPVEVACNGTMFKEAILFTHRGLSGPAILQISSYWNEGDAVSINLLPDSDVMAELLERRTSHPKQSLATYLNEKVPKRFAAFLADELREDIGAIDRLADLSNASLERVAERLHRWSLSPNGTEGYRTAEVTRGGVDTNALSSKTMAATQHTGLYFIGEVVDVTGHLGGFNFQWAWSSGYAAGQAV